MRQIILRAIALVGFVALFGWMVSDLTYQVGRERKVRRELAQAASRDLRYRLENAQQAERSKKILLVAEHDFTRTIVSALDGSHSSAGNHEGIVRVLKEPFPAVSDLESTLGKADFQGTDANGTHMVWTRATWEQPAGGTLAGLPSGARHQRVLEILLARFDKNGKLQELIVSEEGAPAKRIGRSQSYFLR